jgi:hypothetical protein
MYSCIQIIFHIVLNTKIVFSVKNKDSELSHDFLGFYCTFYTVSLNDLSAKELTEKDRI